MPCDQSDKLQNIQETAVFLELKKNNMLLTQRLHAKREILSVNNYFCFWL